MPFRQFRPLFASFALCLGVASMFGAWAQAAEQAVSPEDPVTMSALRIDLRQDSLNITNDIALAEAQARAYPEDPEAQFLLAIAYSRSVHLEKAMKALQRTKRLIKKSPEGYAKVDHLIDSYREMLAYRAEDPLIHYRLAFGYYMKGYAIEHQYIKGSSESPMAYYQQAEAEMRQVIALDPGDIWARNYLGFLLVDREVASEAVAGTSGERLDQAIRIWEDSVGISPENPGAYFLLGEAYLKKGDLRKALEYASKGYAGTGPAPKPVMKTSTGSQTP